MLQDALKAITPPFDFGTAMMYLQEGFRVKRLHWDMDGVAQWVRMTPSADGMMLGTRNGYGGCNIGPLQVIPVSDVVGTDWVLVPE